MRWCDTLEKKLEWLHVRVEPQLKNDVEQMAKNIEVPVSVFVRRLLREGINELNVMKCAHQIPDQFDTPQCFFNYDFPSICSQEKCPLEKKKKR